jgi:hypothetical protein
VPTGAAAATARFAAVDVPLTDDDPATSVLAGDRRRRLLGAVRTLPEPQWRVVACWYFLDLDEAAITTALGLPAGTVKSRLHRALRRLRKYLTSDGTEALERLGILGDAGTETTEVEAADSDVAVSDCDTPLAGWWWALPGRVAGVALGSLRRPALVWLSRRRDAAPRIELIDA